MDALIRNTLSMRQEAIASQWWHALRQTGFTPVPTHQVQAVLRQLVGQTIEAFCAQHLNGDEVETIGKEVARLHYTQPESLNCTLTVLGEELLNGLPASQVTLLTPRLVQLLANIASGFYRQAHAMVLFEQNQIHRALLTTLRERDQQIRMILTNIPMILFAIDKDGTMIFIDGKGLEPLGIQPDQWIGKSVFTMNLLYPPARMLFRRVLNDEDITTTIEVKDRLLQILYTPLHDERSQVQGAIGVALDITERVHAETENQHIRRRLVERVEEERRHLARTLHDDLAQQLLGISYTLHRLQHELPQTHQESLEQTRKDILQMVGHTRHMIGTLRPAGLTELGLSTALDGFVAQMRRETPATIHLGMDHFGKADLPHLTAICLFRSAQEAMRNAIRHAQAETIIITLRREDAQVVLRVCDNGCGFVVPARWHDLTTRNHFGLVGIVEQIALIHGQVTITSQPGNGTEMIISLPNDTIHDTWRNHDDFTTSDYSGR